MRKYELCGIIPQERISQSLLVICVILIYIMFRWGQKVRYVGQSHKQAIRGAC